MASFSLCMIVKNEEAVLERCLNSLSGIFEQIVIVDTGSTDSTVEIAKRYTDEVYHFEWIDDFAAARNYAFSLCTCDYIYAADADEVLDENNRKEFIHLKNTILPEIEIVQFWYVNTKEFQTTENQDKERRPKLYKRLRSFTWIDPIHESVNLNPVLFDSDIEILHMPVSVHSKRDFGVFKKAFERGEYLSKKLHNMYARELLISGNDEDFFNAEEFFLSSVADERRDDEERNESYIILSHINRIKNNAAEFFKWALKNVVTKPCSEICVEIGRFYFDNGDYDEASLWFFNAINETKAEVDFRCQSSIAFKGMAECYEKMAEYNEFLSDYLLDEAAKYNKMAEDSKEL